MNNAVKSGPRLVRAGIGTDGRSTVVAEETATLVAVRENGAHLFDLTPLVAPQQQKTTGVVVRALNMPPATTESADEARASADLHQSDAEFSITVVTGRLRVILEATDVVLDAGDAVILPNVMHDIANGSASEQTNLVFAVYPVGN